MVLLTLLCSLVNAFLAPKPLSLQFNHNRSFKMVDLPDFITSIEPSTIAITSAVLLAGTKLAEYSKMQYVTASILGGIPDNFKIVEIDVRDGKNVFYMPKGTDYTAVMLPNESDPKKLQEKMRINEQLILECVGKANRNGLGLRGKVRTKTQEISAKTVDCVVSVGAINRGQSAIEVINEAYRMLRPGGLFVFIEPDSTGDMVDKILNVFPEKIVGDISAGAKAAAYKAREIEELKTNRPKKDKKRKITDEINDILTAESKEKIVEVKLLNIETGVSTPVETSSTEPIGAPKVRPGITFEKIQNIFDSYVTGIAIRP